MEVGRSLEELTELKKLALSFSRYDWGEHNRDILDVRILERIKESRTLALECLCRSLWSLKPSSCFSQGKEF